MTAPFHSVRALLAAAAGALLAPAMHAEEPPAPALATTFTLAAVSDYKPRGISQSHNRPALQGGADLVHASGFYGGLWFYTIEILRETCKATGTTCGRSVELDLYGGYRTEVAAGATIDVGLIRYQYPGNDLDRAPGFVNANTTEAYLGGGLGPVSVKLSHSLTTFGGFPASRGSSYGEVNLAQPIGDGWTLNAHLGRQVLRNNAVFNATDYRLGIGKTFASGFGASLTFNGSNADRTAWTANGRYWGRDTVVLALQQVF